MCAFLVHWVHSNDENKKHLSNKSIAFFFLASFASMLMTVGCVRLLNWVGLYLYPENPLLKAISSDECKICKLISNCTLHRSTKPRAHSRHMLMIVCHTFLIIYNYTYSYIAVTPILFLQCGAITHHIIICSRLKAIALRCEIFTIK